MNFNLIEEFTPKDRLAYSESFEVERPTVLDRVFPDVKSAHFQAEYFRLMNGSKLPNVAYVHALDTEAMIGTRPSFEHVLTEKLFIKQKINQTEHLNMYIERGVRDNDALLSYVFDDAGNMFEGVLARTKALKGQALATGALSISENNVTLNVDLGVPTENKLTLGNWYTTDYDILGDIETMKETLTDNGYYPTEIVICGKLFNAMKKNSVIQTAIYGASNARLAGDSAVRTLIADEFGLGISICDEKFKYTKANGTQTTARYFPETKVAMYEGGANGAFGTGLWGATPEEQEYSGLINRSQRQFITLTMWSTPDPVATWTKASGLFIPVMQNPNGLVIGTVTTT